MPMPGELGSAAIAGGADLLSGLLGVYSQHQANKTNIMLTRETNELNAKLARENYQLQRDLLERNLQYASPMEQRRMLEEAGYNPYDFVQGTGSKPVAATPTPQLPTMQAAHVEPENALGASIGRIGLDLANYYKTMNDAKKAKEETKGVEMDNRTRLEMNMARLTQMGLENRAIDLKNAYESQSMQDRLDTAKFDALLKEQMVDLTAQQVLELKISNKWADKLNSQTLNKLVQEVNLLIEQGKTEITKQELNRVGVSKAHSEEVLNYVNAQMSRIVGSAQAGMYNAQAAMFGSQSSYYNSLKSQVDTANKISQRDLDYLKEHGYSKVEFEIRNLKSQAGLNTAKEISQGWQNAFDEATFVNRSLLIYEALQQAITNHDWQAAKIIGSFFKPISIESGN